MLKRKINQYNDGVLKFGRYVEKYDNNEILLDEKEFIQEGKLFFSYKTIREQDRLKFDDTGYKIELKINTPYMNKIKSDHIVLIDDITFNGERFPLNLKWVDSKGVYSYCNPSSYASFVGGTLKDIIKPNVSNYNELIHLEEDANPVIFYYEFK